MVARLFEFIWLPSFERDAKKLLSEDDRRAIEERLCEDLEAGQVMERTGGFRKLRHPRPGMGKRGGLRVVYLKDEGRGIVYMALVYAKADKESMTREEERQLRRLAHTILSGDDQ